MSEFARKGRAAGHLPDTVYVLVSDDDEYEFIFEAIHEKLNQGDSKQSEILLEVANDILPEEDKEVFLTFAETNQLALVQQAAIRQKYIDQTQSLNLAFAPTDSPKWIHQVHMEAWKLGVKTLYYLRTDSVIKGDLGSRTVDCVSCDG